MYTGVDNKKYIGLMSAGGAVVSFNKPYYSANGQSKSTIYKTHRADEIKTFPEPLLIRFKTITSII